MTAVQSRQAAALLVGRALLGLIFLVSGLLKIGKFAAVAKYMSSTGMPMSELFLMGTIALEILGGFAIIIGWKARWAATVIFLFLIPVTFLFHPFWAADPAGYSNQLNHFLKNLAIMGGMLYVALLGPGKLSLDHVAERRGDKNPLAEKLAWELAGKQNRWDLVTINPGFIMGPSLSKRTDSTSIDVMIQMASGKFKTGVPSGNMGMVDVRDTARAHILAGFNPNASGRHICVSAEKDFLDIAEVIRRSYPEYPLPKSHAPKWLIWLIAPLIGFSRKYVQLNIGYNLKFDQSYIIKDLGIEFLPFEKTITDHFEQLLNDQIIKRK